jgi:hexosaminidase
MEREGLKGTDELQSYFIRRVEKLLAARGKRLIGWDEIQEGGLPKSATMMVWRDWKWAKHAAENGNDVVMAPTTHTYLDSGQGGHPDGPQYEVIGRTLTPQKVHELEPIPENFTPEEAKRVLGCQAQLWSEYLFNWSKVEYMAFPRACALAEVAWSPKEGKDWGEFEGRLNTHLKRLDALKVNYRRADGTPAVTDRMGQSE